MPVHDTAFLLRQRHRKMLGLCETLFDAGIPADEVSAVLARLSVLLVLHVESVRHVVLPKLDVLHEASPALVLEQLNMTKRALCRLVETIPHRPEFVTRRLELQALLLAQQVIEDRLLLPPLLFRPRDEQRRLSQAVELHELRCAADAAHEADWYRPGLR